MNKLSQATIQELQESGKTEKTFQGAHVLDKAYEGKYLSLDLNGQELYLEFGEKDYKASGYRGIFKIEGN